MPARKKAETPETPEQTAESQAAAKPQAPAKPEPVAPEVAAPAPATAVVPSQEPRCCICDLCALRRHAAEHPETLRASAWRLHTRICPMWKSYQEQTGTENPDLEPQDVALGLGVAVGVGAVIGLTLSALLGGRRRD